MMFGAVLFAIVSHGALAQSAQELWVSTRFGLFTLGEDRMLLFKGRPLDPPLKGNSSIDVGEPMRIGAWGLDVYFMKISPHWGQRETTLAYYQAAREAPGPFIAYQMNWKGENFYTGNHVPAFVSSGKKFQDYILDEKKKGLRTFYFVTEHARTGTLLNELGGPHVFDKLTTPDLNNKFVLVRATFE